MQKKISIIIPVKNGEETIQDSIESILSQTYTPIEIIVSDGISTDNTLNIVQSYGSKIKVISERDGGMYEAINKGILLATGEIIAILNSDDMYANNHIIELVIQEFNKNSSIGCTYGDLEYVSRNNPKKIKRIWKSNSYIPDLFKKGWHPAHPSFFVRKNIYEMHGNYRTDLKIASDYEMMLRLLEIKKTPSSYIPEVLVKMRTGGKSNKSIWNIILGNFESLKAWKLNGLQIPYLIFFKKPYSKLWQIK